MKYFFYTCLFLLSSLISQAQVKSSAIPQARAFFNVTIPGALLADENGNAINKFIVNRFIYMETKGKKPLTIKSISGKGRAYKFHIEEEKETNVIAGNNYNTNLPVKISSSRANRLWKVYLSPASGQDVPEPLKNISIQGNAGGRSFKLILPKDEQLASAAMY